jgi:NADH-quinone oxidoreductase subunit A
VSQSGWDLIAVKPPNVMLDNYFPVFLFLIVGFVFGCVPLILGRVLAPHRPDSEKTSAYECGFNAFENARIQFDVRYYLIAILFILFDLEVAFLLPWATIFKEIVATPVVKTFGFVEMLIFLAILILGYVYAWVKGALDWD